MATYGLDRALISVTKEVSKFILAQIKYRMDKSLERGELLAYSELYSDVLNHPNKYTIARTTDDLTAEMLKDAAQSRGIDIKIDPMGRDIVLFNKADADKIEALILDMQMGMGEFEYVGKNSNEYIETKYGYKNFSTNDFIPYTDNYGNCFTENGEFVPSDYCPGELIESCRAALESRQIDENAKYTLNDDGFLVNEYGTPIPYVSRNGLTIDPETGVRHPTAETQPFYDYRDGSVYHFTDNGNLEDAVYGRVIIRRNEYGDYIDEDGQYHLNSAYPNDYNTRIASLNNQRIEAQTFAQSKYYINEDFNLVNAANPSNIVLVRDRNGNSYIDGKVITNEPFKDITTRGMRFHQDEHGNFVSEDGKWTYINRNEYGDYYDENGTLRMNYAVEKNIDARGIEITRRPVSDEIFIRSENGNFVRESVYQKGKTDYLEGDYVTYYNEAGMFCGENDGIRNLTETRREELLQGRTLYERVPGGYRSLDGKDFVISYNEYGDYLDPNTGEVVLNPEHDENLWGRQSQVLAREQYAAATNKQYVLNDNNSFEDVTCRETIFLFDKNGNRTDFTGERLRSVQEIESELQTKFNVPIYIDKEEEEKKDEEAGEERKAPDEEKTEEDEEKEEEKEEKEEEKEEPESEQDETQTEQEEEPKEDKKKKKRKKKEKSGTAAAPVSVEDDSEKYRREQERLAREAQEESRRQEEQYRQDQQAAETAASSTPAPTETSYSEAQKPAEMESRGESSAQSSASYETTAYEEGKAETQPGEESNLPPENQYNAANEYKSDEMSGVRTEQETPYDDKSSLPPENPYHASDEYKPDEYHDTSAGASQYKDTDGSGNVKPESATYEPVSGSSQYESGSTLPTDNPYTAAAAADGYKPEDGYQSEVYGKTGTGQTSYTSESQSNLPHENPYRTSDEYKPDTYGKTDSGTYQATPDTSTYQAQNTPGSTYSSSEKTGDTYAGTFGSGSKPFDSNASEQSVIPPVHGSTPDSYYRGGSEQQSGESSYMGTPFVSPGGHSYTSPAQAQAENDYIDSQRQAKEQAKVDAARADNAYGGSQYQAAKQKGDINIDDYIHKYGAGKNTASIYGNANNLDSVASGPRMGSGVGGGFTTGEKGGLKKIYGVEDISPVSGRSPVSINGVREAVASMGQNIVRQAAAESDDKTLKVYRQQVKPIREVMTAGGGMFMLRTMQHNNFNTINALLTGPNSAEVIEQFNKTLNTYNLNPISKQGIKNVKELRQFQDNLINIAQKEHFLENRGKRLNIKKEFRKGAMKPKGMTGDLAQSTFRKLLNESVQAQNISRMTKLAKTGAIHSAWSTMSRISKDNTLPAAEKGYMIYNAGHTSYRWIMKRVNLRFNAVRGARDQFTGVTKQVVKELKTANRSSVNMFGNARFSFNKDTRAINKKAAQKYKELRKQFKLERRYSRAPRLYDGVFSIQDKMKKVHDFKMSAQNKAVDIMKAPFRAVKRVAGRALNNLAAQNNVIGKSVRFVQKTFNVTKKITGKVTNFVTTRITNLMRALDAIKNSVLSVLKKFLLVYLLVLLVTGLIWSICQMYMNEQSGAERQDIIYLDT